MEYHIWNIQSKDIDNKFIGRWEITILDQFGTQKSGTTIKVSSVHSNITNNIVRLYSWIIKGSNSLSDSIILDGNIGITGTISEKVAFPGNEHKSWVLAMHLHSIDAKKIISKIVNTEKKIYKIIENICVFDDILPNADSEFCFPMWYYLDQNNYLCGLRIDVPVDKFQKYIQQRDIWYVDCKGIHFNSQISEN